MSSPLEQLPNTYRPFFGSFPALTAAQKALISPILEGRDVVLQAGTGLGKTEAVLAPATERLMTAPHPFTILYILPTKALALDINRRIKPLYKQLGLKSGYRTGDGKTMRDGKPHLLILTPESLDVLLGSPNSDNQWFLKHVRIMIIDEVHVFLNQERGHQLSYLRRRIEMQTLGSLQTLTLSATISSLESITSFFDLKNVFYYQQTAARRLEPCWVHLKDESQELIPFFNDLSLRWRCKKLLVFANSRKKCEQLFDLLNQEGVFSQNVLLHYSNLSTKERRLIESSFRDKKTSICIATSTLEMGIDIGDVDGIVLIGPPPSTMAFLQRIGRGNRRQQHVKFWGVCYGYGAEHQLIRFLALFELAKENQVEKPPLSHYPSVFFQQILSCLYAKKVVSQKFLSILLKTKDLQAIIEKMLEKKWLKPMSEPVLFSGGWRYWIALKNHKIWSNFPPTDEEYDVICEQETIASLPLSVVKQLKMGDIVQLTGKVLKILQIEEKKAYREILVEESDLPPTTELSWYGVGPQTSFEVAQKMGLILLNKLKPQGLLKRTQQLLEKMQNEMEQLVCTSSGIRVRCLQNGAYRYETFLGSVGNLIIHHVMKNQFSSRIEGLSVSFDEMGIETNTWIPLESLKLPHSASLFQEFVNSYLPILQQGFLWNSWFYWLPEPLQEKEVGSRFLDLRVLEHFERYNHTIPLIPPKYSEEKTDEVTKHISLKGEPWSMEKEREVWDALSFPPIPSEAKSKNRPLTASQIQEYVSTKLCPKWAHFQAIQFAPEIHSRFFTGDQEIQARRNDGLAFKNLVIEKLQKTNPVYRETSEFTLKEAIQEVILTQKSLFLIQPTLEVHHSMALLGKPDLIYLKHTSSSVCAEVWDIKKGYSFTYAQKWRIAFYAYLLESILEKQSYALPVKVSELGGLVYCHTDQDKLFDRSHFLLAHFRSWMPRLMAQWKIDSMQHSGRDTMDSTCAPCRYFSYCYQETLFKNPIPNENSAIVPLQNESNHFPKNTKQWFFINYSRECMQWQCWENERLMSETQIHSHEHANWGVFQEAIINKLYREWTQSIDQGKNPHFLVYELAEWHGFQSAFQSTSLKALWARHTCWTSIQSVLEKHFLWPIEGRLTATQVARCLGFFFDAPPPLSLYHGESSFDVPFDIYRQIWFWCLSYVKSVRVVKDDAYKARSVPLIQNYLALHHRECECRTHAILEFQKNPLPKRVENFRAIGPLTFVSSDGPQRYFFSIDPQAPVSKFRVGDFLKLSPVGSSPIQEGFSVSLESYSAKQGTLSIRSLTRKMPLNKNQLYALDECATDWNAPKIEAVLNKLKDPHFRPKLIQMLQGMRKSFQSATTEWIEQWYQTHAHDANLNTMQKKALFLPFLENIGLIEGPPGTGKTHLLVWTLIALCAHAKSQNRSIKILVTAQTHQAIDQILKKASKTFSMAAIQSIPLWKYGRYEEAEFLNLGIQSLKDSKTLMQNSSLIVGATGFGIYQLLEKKNFPQLFDWIIFDESSQILSPQALLSLIFGKGNALFYGDTQQLPPVVLGNYNHTSIAPRSILQELMTQYGPLNRLRLNETYRMNEQISQFASLHWYENQLLSVVPPSHQRLDLQSFPLFCDPLDNALDPSKSMVVVQLDHMGCSQFSQDEAVWIAQAVKRLIQDYSISVEEIGIISPHRLQNNTISHVLKETLPSLIKLPRIDTVERMQGAEFDVVIYSATVSDRETLHSSFLKDYRRFNVALTRSRKKFIFVASHLFFQSFPMTEKELIAHYPFEELFAHCQS